MLAGMALEGITSLVNYNAQKKANQLAADVSKYNTDKTIEYQRQAADLAYARDKEMWNKANAYNSPAEQMLRLKSAGLNPMLAYGSGSVAGNTSGQTPSMSIPNYQANYAAPAAANLSTIGATSALADLQLKKSQIANVEASTRSTNQKTALDALQGSLLAIQKMFSERGLAAETSEKETRAKYAPIEAFLRTAQMAAQNLNTTQSTLNSVLSTPYQLQMLEGGIRKQGKEIRLLEENIKTQMTGRAATRTQMSKTQKETSKVDLEQKLLQLQQLRDSIETELNKRGSTLRDDPKYRPGFWKNVMDNLWPYKRQYRYDSAGRKYYLKPY
jgi:hypothetical protein